jgi:hypothetical protein
LERVRLQRAATAGCAPWCACCAQATTSLRWRSRSALCRGPIASCSVLACSARRRHIRTTPEALSTTVRYSRRSGGPRDRAVPD